MRVKLLLFMVLVLGLVGSVLGAESCILSTDCSVLSHPADFTYQAAGFVSAQGHFSNESDSMTDFPYSLCCPSFMPRTGGNVSFKFSEYNSPYAVNNSHTSIPNSSITSFNSSVYLGTDYCAYRTTGCNADESCIFKMNNPDNAHVANCTGGTVPMPNSFVGELCCKVSEICWDGIDNDRDGFADCADQDCFGGINGVNPGVPEMCGNAITGQMTWMNTSACAIGYNYTTGTPIFNASCIGQAPPPPPVGTYAYYCGYGQQDDPVVEPVGICCLYGTRPRQNPVTGAWSCIDSAQCGIAGTTSCDYDFDLTRNLFYPNNPPHWLNQTYFGDPNNWCNTKVDNLYVAPEVAPYAGSTGCCLIPKFGEINYWLDEDNVQIWG